MRRIPRRPMVLYIKLCWIRKNVIMKYAKKKIKIKIGLPHRI